MVHFVELFETEEHLFLVAFAAEWCHHTQAARGMLRYCDGGWLMFMCSCVHPLQALSAKRLCICKELLATKEASYLTPRRQTSIQGDTSQSYSLFEVRPRRWWS